MAKDGVFMEAKRLSGIGLQAIFQASQPPYFQAALHPLAAVFWHHLPLNERSALLRVFGDSELRQQNPSSA
jgi:hypothetical protein